MSLRTGPALEEVAFLANSSNRVAVLETLAAGPRTRAELLEDLDVSRVTLARILSDLETRRWVEQSGQTCRVTELGAWVVDEFTALVETMEQERRLRRLLSWFPADRVPFDIRCLREATLVVPTVNNISAHVEYSADCLGSARRTELLAFQTAPTLLEATKRAVDEHAQRFEGVLTQKLIDQVMRDSTMATPFLELLDAPLVDVYAYDGTPPVMFFITDEFVGLPLTDADGAARALVVTDEAVVYDWAGRTFRSYCSRAERIDSSAFTL